MELALFVLQRVHVREQKKSAASDQHKEFELSMRFRPDRKWTEWIRISFAEHRSENKTSLKKKMTERNRLALDYRGAGAYLSRRQARRRPFLRLEPRPSPRSFYTLANERRGRRRMRLESEELERAGVSIYAQNKARARDHEEDARRSAEERGTVRAFTNTTPEVEYPAKQKQTLGSKIKQTNKNTYSAVQGSVMCESKLSTFHLFLHCFFLDTLVYNSVLSLYMLSSTVLFLYFVLPFSRNARLYLSPP